MFHVHLQVSLSEEDAQLFKRHYSKLMYQAILTATQKSLQVGLSVHSHTALERQLRN